MTDSVGQTEMSHFATTIMDIALEQGDFISRQTLEELEEMIQPKVMPQHYASLTAPRGDHEDRVKLTKDVIDVVKKMVEVGKFASDIMGKYLGPIGTVAGFVKDIIEHFEEKKEDPVLREIKELSMQLSALSQKMTTHFDDLKSFVVEHNFYDKYTVAISTLYKYMQDTLNDLSTDSIEKFEANYKKSDPQNLVYEIMTKLEQESTNPLKWAMKGDYLKSRDTFNKWKEILDSVLAEALFLEIYASALFPKVGQHGITKILEKTARYKEMLKEWEEDYLTKEYFWPDGIEQLMNEVHDKKSLSTKEAKVNKIWAGIESIMTNCKFYAVVVNSGHIYTLAELTRNTRAVISERNGFVIMIYHNSKKPRKQNEYVWLKEIVPVWNKRAKVLDAFNFNHWSMVRRYMEEDNIARLGHSVAAFIFAVAQSKEHIAVRYSKMDDGSLGPGHFTFDGYVVCDDAITKTTQPIFYLLGYRT